MKVRIDEVPRAGVRLRWQEPPESLDERLSSPPGEPAGGALRGGPRAAAGRRAAVPAAGFPEPRSPIEADLIAARARQRVVAVSGRVRTEVGLECGRCLRAIEARLDLPIALVFVPEAPRPAPRAARDEEEWERGTPAGIDLSELPFELPAEELELLEYAGVEIDLTQAVVDQVVLALPVQPLCAESCKGLCPDCGEDLNAGPCGCGGAPADPRFAVLRALRPDR